MIFLLLIVIKLTLKWNTMNLYNTFFLIGNYSYLLFSFYFAKIIIMVTNKNYGCYHNFKYILKIIFFLQLLFSEFYLGFYLGILFNYFFHFLMQYWFVFRNLQDFILGRFSPAQRLKRNNLCMHLHIYWIKVTYMSRLKASLYRVSFKEYKTFYGKTPQWQTVQHCNL